MKQNWMSRWTPQDIESVIIANDIPEPFTIHTIIKLINKKYPLAHADYRSNGRAIRLVLNRLVSSNILTESYTSVKKSDGYITEINYIFN